MLSKKYSLLFIFITLFSSVFAQVPSFKWANHIKDFSTLRNGPTDIKTDASGNVYVVGRFAGSKDFDPGPGAYNISTPGPGGNSDIFILKLDSLGNFIWVKRIGGSDYEFCGTLAIDTVGNIYLTGQFRQTVDFNPGPAIYNLSSNNWSVFVLKLDVNGDFVYAKQVPGNAPAIALDANYNILVTGWFNGGGDFDPGIGVFNLYGNGGQDAFILKLDNNGDFIWAKAVGGSLSDGGVQIKSDALGNIFVAGHFEGTCNFGSIGANLSALGEKDIFLLKLNSSGNYQWVKGLGGIGYDRIRSIDVDAANNLFATGLFSISCDMDPGPATINFTTSTVSTFLVKLDNAGNHVWSRQFGDSVANAPYCLALDQSGNVYTMGYFLGSGDFDPGPLTHILSTSPNAYNTFISKLDNAGNNLWLGSIGGSASTEGIALTVSNNQNIFITGHYYGTADLNPGVLVDTLSWTGQEDNMFVAGYGKCMQAAAPAMNNPASKLKVCSNATTILSVAGTGTVNWYPSQYSNTSIGTGNNFSTPPLTVNTTYYVDDNNTCALSFSRTAITVTVLALPSISVSSSASEVCVGESVTLTATGANSYLWWGTGSNTNSVVVSPSYPHSQPYGYTVLGTDTNGCNNLGMALVYARLCSGIESFEADKAGIKIYPVPCRGLLTFEADEETSGISSELIITNTLGQMVKQEKIDFNGAKATLDLSHLPTGAYYICLSSNGVKIINHKTLLIY